MSSIIGILRAYLVSLGIGALYCVFILLSYLNSCASWGTRILDTPTFFAVMVGPIAIGAHLLRTGIAAWRKGISSEATAINRALALAHLLVSIGGIVTALYFLNDVHKFSRQFRTSAYAALAARSEPLINAIRLYEKEDGEPPASLESLVPRYLAQVPTTGLGARPNYQYQGWDRSIGAKNRWTISVPGRFFDELSFFPNGDYCEVMGQFGPADEAGRCGPIEIIGTWAYVRDN